MLLEEIQDFEQLLCFHDKAVAVLQKAGLKRVASVIFGGRDYVLFNVHDRTPGKSHVFVIDAKFTFVPGAAAGGADQETVGFVHGTNRTQLKWIRFHNFTFYSFRILSRAIYFKKAASSR